MYLLTSEFLIARFPYNAVRINRVIGGLTVFARKLNDTVNGLDGNNS